VGHCGVGFRRSVLGETDGMEIDRVSAVAVVSVAVCVDGCVQVCACLGREPNQSVTEARVVLIAGPGSAIEMARWQGEDGVSLL
jgi:hypothetical protein